MTANGNPQEVVDILFKTRVEANQAEGKLKKLESKIKKIQSSLEDKPSSIILGVNDTSLIEAEKRTKKFMLSQLEATKKNLETQLQLYYRHIDLKAKADRDNILVTDKLNKKARAELEALMKRQKDASGYRIVGQYSDISTKQTITPDAYTAASNQLKWQQGINKELEKTYKLSDGMDKKGFPHKLFTTFQYSVAGTIIYGVASALMELSKSVVEFDTATRTMSAVLDINLTRSRELGGALVDLGKAYGGTLTDIYGVALALGRAGIETKDLIDGTEVVMRMARLTGDTFEQSTSALISYQQVFGSASLSVTDLGDKLAYVANVSRLSTQDIGTFSNYALSAAKTAGLTVDAVGALAAAFSNAGVNASTIGTQIRTLTSVFSDSSKELQEVFLKFGVSQELLASRLQQGPQESNKALLEFADKLASISTSDFVKYTSGMDKLTKDSLNKLRQNHEEVSKFLKGSLEESKGALQSTDVILQGYAVTWEKTWNKLKDVAIAIGDPIADGMNSMVDQVTTILDQGVNLWSIRLSSLFSADAGESKRLAEKHKALLKEYEITNRLTELSKEAATASASRKTAISREVAELTVQLGTIKDIRKAEAERAEGLQIGLLREASEKRLNELKNKGVSLSQAETLEVSRLTQTITELNNKSKQKADSEIQDNKTLADTSELTTQALYDRVEALKKNDKEYRGIQKLAVEAFNLAIDENKQNALKVATNAAISDSMKDNIKLAITSSKTTEDTYENLLNLQKTLKAEAKPSDKEGFKEYNDTFKVIKSILQATDQRVKLENQLDDILKDPKAKERKTEYNIEQELLKVQEARLKASLNATDDINSKIQLEEQLLDIERLKVEYTVKAYETAVKTNNLTGKDKELAILKAEETMYNSISSYNEKAYRTEVKRREETEKASKARAELIALEEQLDRLKSGQRDSALTLLTDELFALHDKLLVTQKVADQDKLKAEMVAINIKIQEEYNRLAAEAIQNQVALNSAQIEYNNTLASTFDTSETTIGYITRMSSAYIANRDATQALALENLQLEATLTRTSDAYLKMTAEQQAMVDRNLAIKESVLKLKQEFENIDDLKLTVDIDDSGLKGTAKAIAGVSKAFKGYYNDSLRINKIEEKKFKLNEDLMDGLIDSASFKAQEAKLDEERKNAELAGYSALAGAMASAFAQGSNAAIAFAAVQATLGIASAWTSIANAWALPFPSNIPAVAMVTSAVMPLISQLTAMGGKGGGGSSGPSVTSTGFTFDQNREQIEGTYAPLTDRLDRQIELLESIDRQGSASQLGIELAATSFERDVRIWIEDVLEKARQGFVAGGGVTQEQVSGVNAIYGADVFQMSGAKVAYNADVLREGTNLIKTLITASETGAYTGTLYQSAALKAGYNWSNMMTYIDIEIEKDINEYQNLVHDWAMGVLDSMEDLKDAADSFKGYYDGITGSMFYETERLNQAYTDVNKLRGTLSFADYLKTSIAEIEKLQKFFTDDVFTLLMSNDKADIEAQIAAIDELGRITGQTFEGGAKEALNYLESIELVAEAMERSRENIKSFLDSLLTDEQLAGNLASSLGVSLASNVDELARLFIDLSTDVDGLTDSELELLNANKALLENTDEYQVQIDALNLTLDDVTGSISTLESVLSSIKSTIDKLRGASLTSEQSLQKYYDAIAEAQRLSATKLYDEYSEAVKAAIDATSALFETKNFQASRDMLFAQLMAANQFEDLQDVTMTEIDYLKQIEINTRTQIDVLVAAMNSLGSNVSSSLSAAISSVSAAATSSRPAADTTSSYIKDIYTKYDLNKYQTDSSGYAYWEQQVKSGAIAVKDLDKAIKVAAEDILGTKLTGYATGGYTGDGGKFDVAGIVHKGEYVVNSQTTKDLGLNNSAGVFNSMLKELALLRQEISTMKQLSIRQTATQEKSLSTQRAILGETLSA